MANETARIEMKTNLTALERACGALAGILSLLIVLYAVGAALLKPAATSKLPYSLMIYAASSLIVVMIASAVVGAVLGFLFGIPKQMQASGSLPGTNTTDNARPVAAAYSVNTNLDEISDWLTKIIVGVSLVQATLIYTHFKRIAAFFGTSVLQDTPGGTGVFALVTIASLAIGFLFAYLETRTRITLLLVQAEVLWRSPEEALAKAVAEGPALSALSPTGLAAKDGEAPLAKPQDAEIVKVPFSNLDTSGKLSAWGAAQLRLGQAKEANEAFEKAIGSGSSDPQLYLAQAAAKLKLNDPQAADTVVRKAASLFPDNRAVLRNRVYTSLYLPKPKGYEASIKAAEQLKEAFPAAYDTPKVQLWIACANGQKYDTVTAPEEKQAAYDAALAAIKRLVELAPDQESPERVLARNLFNPEREGSSLEEDDLEPFQGFEEFSKLIYG